MLIGDYLKLERLKKGYSIVELSEKAGISKSYLSELERGNRSGWKVISKVMMALDLTMEDARAADVEWWAIDGKPSTAHADYSVTNDDLSFIIEWAKAQDDVTLKALRTFINSLGG